MAGKYIVKCPIVIAGSGRSGTTWVLDVLAEANGLQTIFEPLHPQAVPGAERFADRYIGEDVRDDALRKFMDRVFEGNCSKWWTKYRIRQDQLVPAWADISSFHRAKHFVDRYRQAYINYYRYRNNAARPLIVKFIRSNLMMGWLGNNYNTKNAFVVRHPGAVVASKLRLGWAYDRPLIGHMKDRALVNAYLYNYMSYLEKTLNPIEAHTAIWCIENVIPLLEFSKKGWPIIFYERLIVNGQTEWASLVKQLGLEKSPLTESVARPSQQTCRTGWGESSIESWRTQFTSAQLDQIQSVLNVFGVTVYKAREATPISLLQGTV